MSMNPNASVKELWDHFVRKNPFNKIKDQPLSYYFCDNEIDANLCAELVTRGIKKATSSLFMSYEKNNEKIPSVGNQFIVTDWSGNAKCIIEITKIELIPFNEISEKFAEAEGEGDKSLEYWKKVHKTFFKKECESFGKNFNENMIVVCEYFKKV